MGARRLLNLFLLLLVICAAAAVLLSRHGPSPGPSTLTRIDPATITHITVKREREPALRFERRGGQWDMTAPVTAAANPSRIRAILHLLQVPSHARLSANGSDLHTLNLDPAPLSVRLDDQVFHLGGTDPVDGLRYVRHGGGVYLVNDTLFHQLTQPASFFIATRLLPEDAAITQITYPDHVLILEDGIWHSRPGPVVPDRSATAIIRAWRKAAAQRVLPYLERPAAGKVVINTGAAVIVFDIIPTSRALLLARPDLNIQYRLSNATAADLALTAYLPD